VNGRRHEFLRKLQRFTANAMITGSALRNSGASGVVGCAQEFCAAVPLASLHRMHRSRYQEWLDARTRELRERFPADAQNWGPARKALNIFMRSAAYMGPLASEFQLERIVPFLEVPLDSHVACGLIKAPEGEGLLPAWKSIISLTADRNRMYQSVASNVARRMRVHRADLDVFFWRA